MQNGLPSVGIKELIWSSAGYIPGTRIAPALPVDKINGTPQCWSSVTTSQPQKLQSIFRLYKYSVYRSKQVCRQVRFDSVTRCQDLRNYDLWWGAVYFVHRERPSPDSYPAWHQPVYRGGKAPGSFTVTNSPTTHFLTGPDFVGTSSHHTILYEI